MTHILKTIPIEGGKSIKLKLTKHQIKYIVSEVIEDRCYFPKIKNKDFEIKDGDTVIDIGGNVGVFAVYASKLTPKGKVYSFEPVKNNFHWLEENKKLNNANNLILENKAISDSTKKVKIHLEKLNSGGHSFYKEKYEKLGEAVRSTEIIEAISLKEVFDKYDIKKCDFLKIDCEGEEYNLLKALPSKYFEKINKIAIEFHPNVDEIALARHLRKMGFKVTIYNLDEILGMIFARKKKKS